MNKDNPWRKERIVLLPKMMTARVEDVPDAAVNGNAAYQGNISMRENLASENVDRSYSLAATSISILTFVLFFLYPLFARGEIDALVFQAMLVVMGLATFSFAFASFYYYGASLGDRFDVAERARSSRRGDLCWLLGCVLLFFAPSLVLFSLGLLVVALTWLALWLGYMLFVIRYFPRIQTGWKHKENR